MLTRSRPASRFLTSPCAASSAIARFTTTAVPRRPEVEHRPEDEKTEGSICDAVIQEPSIDAATTTPPGGTEDVKPRVRNIYRPLHDARPRPLPFGRPPRSQMGETVREGITALRKFEAVLREARFGGGFVEDRLKAVNEGTITLRTHERRLQEAASAEAKNLKEQLKEAVNHGLEFTKREAMRQKPATNKDKRPRDTGLNWDTERSTPPKIEERSETAKEKGHVPPNADRRLEKYLSSEERFSPSADRNDRERLETAERKDNLHMDLDQRREQDLSFEGKFARSAVRQDRATTAAWKKKWTKGPKIGGRSETAKGKETRPLDVSQLVEQDMMSSEKLSKSAVRNGRAASSSWNPLEERSSKSQERKDRPSTSGWGWDTFEERFSQSAVRKDIATTSSSKRLEERSGQAAVPANPAGASDHNTVKGRYAGGSTSDWESFEGRFGQTVKTVERDDRDTQLHWDAESKQFKRKPLPRELLDRDQEPPRSQIITEMKAFIWEEILANHIHTTGDAIVPMTFDPGPKPEEKFPPLDAEFKDWLQNAIDTAVSDAEFAAQLSNTPVVYNGPTVLVLNGASKSLLESDFYRMARPGKHLEDWAVGIARVIQQHDPATYEPQGKYYIIFYTRAAALAYQEEITRLHKLSVRAMHLVSEQQKQYEDIPGPLPLASTLPSEPQPSTIIDDDTAASIRSYTLLPPGVNIDWHLKLYLCKNLTIPTEEQPSWPGIDTQHLFLPTTDTDSGVPAPTGYHRVLVNLDGGQRLTIPTLHRAIVQDGQQRGLPWDLLPVSGEDSIPIAGVRLGGRWEMYEHGQGSPPQFTRFLVPFSQAAEARRFARNWHRREMEGLASQIVCFNVRVLW